LINLDNLGKIDLPSTIFFRITKLVITLALGPGGTKSSHQKVALKSEKHATCS
jgi:hypothetical protein